MYNCLGGGRYIPGSGSSAPRQAAVAPTENMSDPLTGGGRYVPQYSNQAAQASQPTDPFTGIILEAFIVY